jgi:hypothetical protein
LKYLEPFVERIGASRSPGGTTSYRIGYRADSFSAAVTSITVPAGTLEKALNSEELLTLAITPTGEVTAVISFVDSAELTLHASLPIDRLVRNALETENLRMEEATAADLNTLLQSLERSVGLVRDAIDQMATSLKASS